MEIYEGEEFFELLPDWALIAAANREAEMLAKSILNSNMDNAYQVMRPLQDAFDIGEISEEESTRLVQWKRYRIALSKTQERPGWPEIPDWPVSPDF